MSVKNGNELPFRLADMTEDEFYREIDDCFQTGTPLPSGSESEVDISDIEDEENSGAANIDQPISDSKSSQK